MCTLDSPDYFLQIILLKAYTNNVILEDKIEANENIILKKILANISMDNPHYLLFLLKRLQENCIRKTENNSDHY